MPHVRCWDGLVREPNSGHTHDSIYSSCLSEIISSIFMRTRGQSIQTGLIINYFEATSSPLKYLKRNLYLGVNWNPSVSLGSSLGSYTLPGMDEQSSSWWGSHVDYEIGYLSALLVSFFITHLLMCEHLINSYSEKFTNSIISTYHLLLKFASRNISHRKCFLYLHYFLSLCSYNSTLSHYFLFV